MALTGCPECSKPVSDKADKCPSCGYLLQGGRTRTDPTKRTLAIVAVCLGLFGAIVGFTVGTPVFGAMGAVAVVLGIVKLAAPA